MAKEDLLNKGALFEASWTYGQIKNWLAQNPENDSPRSQYQQAYQDLQRCAKFLNRHGYQLDPDDMDEDISRLDFNPSDNWNLKRKGENDEKLVHSADKNLRTTSEDSDSESTGDEIFEKSDTSDVLRSKNVTSSPPSIQVESRNSKRKRSKMYFSMSSSSDESSSRNRSPRGKKSKK